MCWYPRQWIICKHIGPAYGTGISEIYRYMRPVYEIHSYTQSVVRILEIPSDISSGSSG